MYRDNKKKYFNILRYINRKEALHRIVILTILFNTTIYLNIN